MPTLAHAARIRDRHTIVFERLLSATIERAWQAITTKPDLDRWLMITEIDLQPGGRFAFERGWDGRIGQLDLSRHWERSPSVTA